MKNQLVPGDLPAYVEAMRYQLQGLRLQEPGMRKALLKDGFFEILLTQDFPSGLKACLLLYLACLNIFRRLSGEISFAVGCGSA